jgi:hypothetical protein
MTVEKLEAGLRRTVGIVRWVERTWDQHRDECALCMEASKGRRRSGCHLGANLLEAYRNAGNNADTAIRALASETNRLHADAVAQAVLDLPYGFVSL